MPDSILPQSSQHAGALVDIWHILYKPPPQVQTCWPSGPLTGKLTCVHGGYVMEPDLRMQSPQHTQHTLEVEIHDLLSPKVQISSSVLRDGKKCGPSSLSHSPHLSSCSRPCPELVGPKTQRNYDVLKVTELLTDRASFRIWTCHVIFCFA